jgi:hypothetical protein
MLGIDLGAYGLRGDVHGRYMSTSPLAQPEEADPKYGPVCNRGTYTRISACLGHVRKRILDNIFRFQHLQTRARWRRLVGLAIGPYSPSAGANDRAIFARVFALRRPTTDNIVR